jgi:hypothetical protein
MMNAVFSGLQRFDRNKAMIPYGVFLLRITPVAIWIAHWQ